MVASVSLSSIKHFMDFRSKWAFLKNKDKLIQSIWKVAALSLQFRAFEKKLFKGSLSLSHQFSI